MYDVALVQGDLPHVCSELRGDELIAQRLRIRLWTHRGEVIDDASAGMLYFRAGTKVQARTIAVQAMREAEQIPGVKRAELAATLTPGTRRINVVGTVVLDDGTRAGVNVASQGVLAGPPGGVV